MSKEQGLLAILVYDLSSTGVVRNAIRIAKHAAAGGLPTELWVWRNEGPFKENIPDKVGLVEINGSKGLDARYGVARRFRIALGIPGLARLLRERHPAVLLSAGNRCHLAAGLAYRLCNRPVHTRLVGRASNAIPLSAGRNILGTFAGALDSAKYKELHQIVPVSHELASDLHLRLGLPKERITVIPNGIDLTAIKRSASESLDHLWFRAGEPPVIVAAGTLCKQKNYPLLLKTFSNLRLLRKARLVILGDGPTGAREALKLQAKRLGVAEDVELVGYDPNPMRYFARAGVYVLSSLWEGASNALLEALACGCPAVATDCPTGVRELLDHGRIGSIAPLNDAAALAHAILRRLEAPRNSSELQAHAAKFDVSVTLNSYFKLIQSEAAAVAGA